MGVPDVNGLLVKTLTDHGVGSADFTGQIHALKYKAPLYLRPGNPIGIVMHNTAGMVTLPNLVGTWKSKEPNPPPSHLAIDQAGQVGRYVRLQYADRATENTNRHLSIEFQAVEGGGITSQQITTGAIIAAFAHVIYGVDLAIAESRTAKGLAHHSIFVDKGNPQGHSNCPGGAIIETKGRLLEQARRIAAAMAFDDEPAGRWYVRVDKWAWLYTFDANGNVSWLDQGNGKSGKGTWRVSPGVMTLSWTGSATRETWTLPLRPAAQGGSCTMDGETYDVKAVRA
jgi:hypothetical protein